MPNVNALHQPGLFDLRSDLPPFPDDALCAELNLFAFPDSMFADLLMPTEVSGDSGSANNTDWYTDTPATLIPNCPITPTQHSASRPMTPPALDHGIVRSGNLSHVSPPFKHHSLSWAPTIERKHASLDLKKKLDEEFYSMGWPTATLYRPSEEPRLHDVSTLKGIVKEKAKYRAKVKINQKVWYLGYFEDPIEGAEAYDLANLFLNRTQCLNFPNKDYSRQFATKRFTIHGWLIDELRRQHPNERSQEAISFLASNPEPEKMGKIKRQRLALEMC